ncbi:MAG: hypothetical protein CSA66_00490 [Proteobacteria bacterium]|nr:MAG: hypothetical protein CSA66_00490 [Pseudomonadota bacterium]
MTPFKIGVVAAAAAAAMVVVELLGHDWFIIRLGGFRLPLWILVAIYAGLQLWIWRLTTRRLVLTEDEVARWGDKLEQATPKILGLYEQHTPVKEIAELVEQSHGIPPYVTLRYIIALAQHAKARGADTSEAP